MKKYMVWYETLTIVAFKLIEFDSDWMLILDSTCILINLWVVNLNIRVKKKLRATNLDFFFETQVSTSALEYVCD